MSALDLTESQDSIPWREAFPEFKAWIGDPRVNVQNDKGQTKVYQVRQVLKAIERMEIEHGTEKR